MGCLGAWNQRQMERVKGVGGRMAQVLGIVLKETLLAGQRQQVAREQPPHAKQLAIGHNGEDLQGQGVAAHDRTLVLRSRSCVAR